MADNPALSGTDYEKQLLDLPEAQKKALLFGDWSSWVGQVFSSYQYARHTCNPIDPAKIPDSWDVWRSCDDVFIEIPPGLDHGTADVETPFGKTLVVEFVSVSGNFPAGEHPIELQFTAEPVQADLLWNFQGSANDRDFFIVSQQIRLYVNPRRLRGFSVRVTRDVVAGTARISGSVIGYLVNTP